MSIIGAAVDQETPASSGCILCHLPRLFHRCQKWALGQSVEWSRTNPQTKPSSHPNYFMFSGESVSLCERLCVCLSPTFSSHAWLRKSDTLRINRPRVPKTYLKLIIIDVQIPKYQIRSTCLDDKTSNKFVDITKVGSC